MKSAAGRIPTRRRPACAGGFSLVELLVTLIVVAEILVIASVLFDLHNKTAKAQNQVADLQQSLRVAQREMVELVRMGGRGGQPAQHPQASAPTGTRMDRGLAIEVENNVGSGVQIVAADDETAVVPGTDVLRVRGIFSAPIYQLLSVGMSENPNVVYEPDPEDPASATHGTVVVATPSPAGYGQNLQPLADAAADDALILVSPLSDSIYAVVSVETVTVTGQDADGNPTQVTIRFQTVGGTHAAAYRGLFTAANNLPSNLKGVAFLGLLEEHVFYVRDVHAIPGDPSSEAMPRLARAQVLPRTDVGVGAESSDIADNVVDLQVALGYNSTLGPGGYFDRDRLDDLVIEETADGDNDDWLFNSSQDDPEDAPWLEPWGDPPGTPQPELYYVRITTLARTEGREFQYISPPIRRLEDHAYNESAVPAVHDPDRAFHRRMLRTVVDVRGL